MRHSFSIAFPIHFSSESEHGYMYVGVQKDIDHFYFFNNEPSPHESRNKNAYLTPNASNILANYNVSTDIDYGGRLNFYYKYEGNQCKRNYGDIAMFSDSDGLATALALLLRSEVHKKTSPPTLLVSAVYKGLRDKFKEGLVDTVFENQIETAQRKYRSSIALAKKSGCVFLLHREDYHFIQDNSDKLVGSDGVVVIYVGGKIPKLSNVKPGKLYIASIFESEVENGPDMATLGNVSDMLYSAGWISPKPKVSVSMKQILALVAISICFSYIVLFLLKTFPQQPTTFSPFKTVLRYIAAIYGVLICFLGPPVFLHTLFYRRALRLKYPNIDKELLDTADDYQSWFDLNSEFVDSDDKNKIPAAISSRNQVLLDEIVSKTIKKKNSIYDHLAGPVIMVVGLFFALRWTRWFDGLFDALNAWIITGLQAIYTLIKQAIL